MKNKVFILIIIAIPVFLFFQPGHLSSNGVKETSDAGVEAGNTAPDFSLHDLKGELYNLKAVRDKKVVLLVFWATWCPYCVQEIPELNKIYQEYSGKGLEVWAINIKEEKSKVSKFASKRGINYTILLDSTGGIASSYEIFGIPTNIIVDKKGIVRHNGKLPKYYDVIFKELTKSTKQEPVKKGL